MKKRRLLLVGIDLLIFIAVSCAMLFIFFGNNYNVKTPIYSKAFHFAVGAILLFSSRLLFFAYNRVWRYAGYNDYFRLLFSDFTAGFVCALLNRFLFSSESFEKFLGENTALEFLQVLAIYGANCLACLTARFLYQHFRDKTKQDSDAKKISVAIVGAGSVGVLLAKELLANKYSKYKPVYFIERDKSKVGYAILDIPVIEENDDIVKTISDLPIQGIVIALPRLSPAEKAEKYHLYQQTGLMVKIYDYPLEAESGEKRTLRDVRIEDLLFRDAIDFSDSRASSYYAGKTVLITGGGGSIGSELCRQIAKAVPKHLVILDIYENNAYEIQQSLIRKYGDKLKLSVEIASVRDCEKLDEIFDKYKPQIVLHAAAHKHVPLMEDCPSEAIKNNVFGTYNTAETAEKYGVEKFILISTDKAVNPTNIMGATKRLCEMIIQSKKDSKTDFVAVRFGNVLGSNGSVIPLFRKQIENGGPVTVTDKRIIRYFMTIPEAAQLVLEAGSMAAKSEIYVLDMGKPVKIIDLAENMIRLSGFTPYVDIDIEVVGLRPGEKLYEELLIQKEDLDKTDNSLIFIDHDEIFSRDDVDQKLQRLTDSLATHDGDTIRHALMDSVPTFHNAEEVNKDALKSEEMKMVQK